MAFRCCNCCLVHLLTRQQADVHRHREASVPYRPFITLMLVKLSCRIILPLLFQSPTGLSLLQLERDISGHGVVRLAVSIPYRPFITSTCLWQRCSTAIQRNFNPLPAFYYCDADLMLYDSTCHPEFQSLNGLSLLQPISTGVATRLGRRCFNPLPAFRYRNCQEHWLYGPTWYW